MNVISRREALSQGLSYYFTGKPCKHGHVSQRRTNSRICMDCQRDYESKNREKRREKNRKYRLKNIDKLKGSYRDYYRKNRDILSAKNKRYHSENLEKIAERKSKNRSENPEKFAESYRRWAKANPIKVAVKARNRRAVIKMCGGTHTPSDIELLLNKQGKKCVGCNADLRLGYHVDHIMPLALGGSNDRKNLQILCPKCNLKKQAKHPIDWARENGRLV
jgi:5-methylcytosine-specific restriction endonuclease McrA